MIENISDVFTPMQKQAKKIMLDYNFGKVARNIGGKYSEKFVPKIQDVSYAQSMVCIEHD